MNKDLHSYADQFVFYDQLGLYYQWKFRRHLSVIGPDLVSLTLLLEYEKELNEKSILSPQRAKIIENLLTWVYKEDHNELYQNRLQFGRFSEILQIAIIFFDKSHAMHRSYRNLVLKIIEAGDYIGREEKTVSGVTPEQFRLEAAKGVSNFSRQWGKWDARVSEKAEQWISYLVNIADKVSNISRFEMVCKERASVIGYDITSFLMEVSDNIQAFESYYDRVIVQMNLWGQNFKDLFRRSSKTIEILSFLEALAKNPRWHNCVLYEASKDTEYAKHSLKPVYEVKRLCWNHEWENELDTEKEIDNLIQIYTKKIVDMSIGTIRSATSAHNIRWKFDKFTEYIPIELENYDWTSDNAQTRQYWNWHHAADNENNQFREAFSSTLISTFNELDCVDYDLLIGMVAQSISIREFVQSVDIPVRWKKGYVYQETYARWIGFYDEKVKVLYPTAFQKHDFVFECLDLQKALDLIESMDKIHEAIQTQRKLIN